MHTVDDEWQQVPDEWLSASQRAERGSADDESELSDLSEDEPGISNDSLAAEKDGNSSDSALSEAPSAVEVVEPVEGGPESGDDNNDEGNSEQNGDEDEQEDEFELGLKEAVNLPEGFIEWEAVS